MQTLIEIIVCVIARQIVNLNWISCMDLTQLRISLPCKQGSISKQKHPRALCSWASFHVSEEKQPRSFIAQPGSVV